MWNWILRACIPWPACTHSLYVYTAISMLTRDSSHGWNWSIYFQLELVDGLKPKTVRQNLCSCNGVKIFNQHFKNWPRHSWWTRRRWGCSCPPLNKTWNEKQKISAKKGHEKLSQPKYLLLPTKTSLGPVRLRFKRECCGRGFNSSYQYCLVMKRQCLKNTVLRNQSLTFFRE